MKDNRSGTRSPWRALAGALVAALLVFGLSGLVQARPGLPSDGVPPTYGEYTRAIRMTSVDISRLQGDGSSEEPAMSSDGRYVAFSSWATNLVPSDTNGTRDVFRKDVLSGEVMLCSASIGGTQGNMDSCMAAISADGRYVVFSSNASNLVTVDTNRTSDVFRKDCETGVVSVCSSDAVWAIGNGPSVQPTVSGDGRFVAFASDASNLVPGDTNMTTDIFRKDLGTGDNYSPGGGVVRCSTDSSGRQSNSTSLSPAIDFWGRYVAFDSWANNLVADDTNGMSDVFRKDAGISSGPGTGQTVRCSTDAYGRQGNKHSYSPAISAEGKYVAFCSEASNLVAGDANGCGDIFRKEPLGGQVQLCSVGPGWWQGNRQCFLRPTISADGKQVAFSSLADNLAAGDYNGMLDVFWKDLASGELICCSADKRGRIGDGQSFWPSISADGRLVSFCSEAGNLVTGDTNMCMDTFRKDTRLTTTTW